LRRRDCSARALQRHSIRAASSSTAWASRAGARRRSRALLPSKSKDVRASGLSAVHLTVGASARCRRSTPLRGSSRHHALGGRDRAPPGVFARVRTVEDIRRAQRDDQAGLVYGCKTACRSRTTRQARGPASPRIRVLQPTYNRRNLLGDGCMEPADAGLSRAGHEAIERMNALGILVDLSHCGRRTASDAIRTSKRPVAFTHTGCYALAQHPRSPHRRGVACRPASVA